MSIIRYEKQSDRILKSPIFQGFLFFIGLMVRHFILTFQACDFKAKRHQIAEPPHGPVIL